MKRFFSILLALTATVAAAHAADRTMLKLRLSDRTLIAVDIDGRFINRQTTSLTLDGLRPGMHRVEVYSTSGYRSRPVRIYTGSIRLEPGTVNIAIVDVYNRALRMRVRPIDEERDRVYAEDDRRNENKDADYEGHDSRYNDQRNDGTRDSRRDDVYGDNNADGNNDRGTGEGYGSFPHGRNNNTAPANILSQRDMDDLQSRVGKRITDSDKESLLKSVVENRSVYTDQVRAMLHWLTFESTRLDFAKWAYSRAADRQNYWKLEDVFDFSSSKTEFNNAIRGR